MVMMMSSDLSMYTKLQALRSAPANSTTTEASSSTAPAQVLQHPPKKFRRLMTDFESRNRMASDEIGAVLSSLLLSLSGTLQRSATVHSCVILALHSGRTSIARIHLLFLPLWHLISLPRLHHKPM